jgi:glycosyltransferase involved in cell wall biosynthesis
MQVMKVCQSLTQIGHHVTLLVPGQISYHWDQLAEQYGLSTPFEVIWLPAHAKLRRYDFAWKAILQARQLNADVLYVWALQAATAGIIWKMPVLLEIHGPPEGRLGPQLFRLFLRLPGKKRILPITNALQSILQRSYPRLMKNLDVILAPNGVDIERFKDLLPPTAARRELGLPDHLTAGYTGHLYAGRGMDLLVELAKRFPQIHFLWVGGRPQDVTSWEEKLSVAGLSNVKLLGFIKNKELPQYQAAMDIVLMPYERVIEGSGGGNSADYCSPMKMFEYMASGRAILSSDLPPIREVLDDDIAMLCPPEQIEPWALAMDHLVKDADHRKRLGENAQRRVEQYAWRARAERCLQNF